MPTPSLTRLEQWERIDPFFERDILAAIEDGGTLRQAARAAGVPERTMEKIREWGAAGRAPWNDLYSKMERARYAAEKAATRRRLDIASAPEATMHETKSFLQVVNREDYGEQPAAPVAAAGGSRIIIHKAFVASGTDKALAPHREAFEALPDPDVVDGEVVDE